MFKKIILINVLLMTACTLIKQEKYITTDKFSDEAYKICMSSNKYAKQPQQSRKSICQKDAQTFITSAEKKFRQYKADEHNYRLCRSRFADIRVSDKCFRQQQEKYYRRELEGYKAKLNGTDDQAIITRSPIIKIQPKNTYALFQRTDERDLSVYEIEGMNSDGLGFWTEYELLRTIHNSLLAETSEWQLSSVSGPCSSEVELTLSANNGYWDIDLGTRKKQPKQTLKYGLGTGQSDI